METYANALLYAIPFFTLLLIIEIGYGYFKKDQKHKVLDSVSSISSGFTNIIKDTIGIGFVLVSYPYLLEHLAIIEIKVTGLIWFIAFIAIDFAGYWNHRLSHKINFFWNQHVIHHSSEEFNLACALRQPISNLLGYFAVLLFPAAFFGVPNEVIITLVPIHLFAQFWYHTRHINKMGWLEYIIVTPSQHRVHHAINPEYIDKNLGQVLCIWDRLFGTFQEELENIPPQYGVLKPAATWNPVIINFQHLWRLIQDAWRTNSYRDKFRIWFMPTGWRPKDVITKYPIALIDNVYNFKRYSTTASTKMKAYAIFQLTCTMLLLLFMFDNYVNIEFENLALFSLILFIGVYGYTSLMDRTYYAVYIEIIRAIVGIIIIYINGDWFGISIYGSWASVMVAIYFIITLLVSIYFTYFEKLNASKSIV